MKISQAEYNSRFPEVTCSHIRNGSNKRNTRIVIGPRYVATKTVREILVELNAEGNNCGISSVYKSRPFFVGVPTEREKLECLCSVCLNARVLFNKLMCTVKQQTRETPSDSITMYLTAGKICQIARSGYAALTCIQ